MERSSLFLNLTLVLAGAFSVGACSAQPSGLADSRGPKPGANEPSKTGHSGEHNTPAHPDTLVFDKVFPKDCQASATDPFLCVRQTCESVGGSFDASQNSCLCPDSSHFFTAYFGGHCLPLNTPETSEAYVEFLLKASRSKGQPGGENLFGPLLTTREAEHEQGLSPAFVGVAIAPQQPSEAMMESLMELSNLRVRPSIVSLLPKGLAETKIIVGPSSVRNLMGNLIPYEIKFTFTSFPFRRSRVILERDFSRIPKILSAEPDPGAAYLKPPAGADALLVQAASEAYHELRSSSAPTQLRAYTRNACAGHCVLIRETRAGQMRVSEERQYSGGALLRHQILLFEKSSQLPATVVEIDPTGAPTLVYVLETRTVGPRTERLVRLYNRDGQSLGAANPLDLDFDTAAILSYRSKIAEKPAGNDSVVVCEDGFDGADVENSTTPLELRVGPFLNQPGKANGSLYGWLENPSGSFEQLTSGVSWMSMYGLPHRYGNHKTHAVGVSELVAERGGGSIIPIGVKQCFRAYSDWKRQVAATGARVINVSYTQSLDSASCEASEEMRQSVLDPKKPFLWILGAGNDRDSSDNREDHENCPQNLGPRSNLIVVAAISDTWIPDYAEYGRYYADVFANDWTLDGKQRGSSFSAPRVSRVAARLARQFPRLGPKEIRMAILLGAKIPSGNSAPRFMPVRSGGILDEDGAMGIARILNTEGWLVTKPELLLKRFRCDPLWYWQRGECERNADAQIRWLNGSDAFSNN